MNLMLSLWLAGSTGLEPAASGVTGRRSNQLNYDPKQTAPDVQQQPPQPDKRERQIYQTGGRSPTRILHASW